MIVRFIASGEKSPLYIDWADPLIFKVTDDFIQDITVFQSNNLLVLQRRVALLCLCGWLCKQETCAAPTYCPPYPAAVEPQPCVVILDMFAKLEAKPYRIESST